MPIEVEEGIGDKKIDNADEEAGDRGHCACLGWMIQPHDDRSKAGGVE